MKRKFFILANPISGKINKQKALDQLLARLNALHIASQYTCTKYRGHATEILSTQLSEDFTDLVIIGGDGTLNEAINGPHSRKYYPHRYGE